MEQQNAPVSFLKKWWISARPFSFPASTMPVIFGTVLAVVYGESVTFKPLLFVLAFIGMVILHSGANILSDIFDYKKGLDKVPSPVSGGIVRGLITIREAWIASVLMLTFGTIIGLYLTWVSGPWLLAIGLFTIGLIIVGAYFGPRAPENDPGLVRLHRRPRRLLLPGGQGAAAGTREPASGTCPSGESRRAGRGAPAHRPPGRAAGDRPLCAG